MPNYVRNNVVFEGDENKIKELRDFMTSEKSSFDFNKIAPMPKELDIECGGRQKVVKEFALLREEIGKNWKRSAEFKKLAENFDKTYVIHGEKFDVVSSRTFEEWADIGEQYFSNLELYGAETWYDWRLEHWGTKWEACEPRWVDSNCVEFDTAWNMPEPIYRKLAKMFPEVHFEVEFADEDIGSNCGTVTYEGDTVFVNYLDDEEFACEIWGYNYEEWKEENE